MKKPSKVLTAAAFVVAAVPASSAATEDGSREPVRTSGGETVASPTEEPRLTGLLEFVAKAIETDQTLLASPNRPPNRPPSSPPGQNNPPNPPGKPPRQ
jgi:hypothetical protein